MPENVHTAPVRYIDIIMSAVEFVISKLLDHIIPDVRGKGNAGDLFAIFPRFGSGFLGYSIEYSVWAAQTWGIIEVIPRSKLWRG